MGTVKRLLAALARATAPRCPICELRSRRLGISYRESYRQVHPRPRTA